MAEATTPLQQTEFRIKRGLKSIFFNYNIKPSEIMCHFDCLTWHQKKLIRKMELEDTSRAAEELFDRLLEQLYWVDSFVTGVKRINKNLNYPDEFYKAIDNLFRDITIGVAPGYIIDETEKISFTQETVSDIVASMEDSEPRSVTAKVIKSKYSTFKKNLLAVDEILDKLLEEGILNTYDSDDIKNAKRRRTSIDKLLKIILRKEEDCCKKFLEIVSLECCGSQGYLLKIKDQHDSETLNLTKRMKEDLKQYGLPNIEELMDLLVETDSFSLRDHEDVLEAKTRQAQKSVLLQKIETDSQKQDIYWRTLYLYYKESHVRNGIVQSNSPVEIVHKYERELSIDCPELLMEVDPDETTNSKLDMKISIYPDSKKLWNKDLITDEIMDKLAELFENKLKITGTCNGSVIIELEAQSQFSVTYLRQAYLDGKMDNIINGLLDLTGIKNHVCVKVQVGFTKNREKRKNLQAVLHVQILNRNQYFLMEELDPYPVLKSMNQHGLLNENQVNWILKKKPIGRETAVKELISLLKWMDQSDFDMFLTILQQGSQSYIYEHLTKQHDLVALRKTMNDNLDVIADAMDGKTLRNLYLKVQGLAVHDRRNYKQLISKIINDFNEDNTLIFADSLHASGLDLLVKEDKNEKSKFEKKQRYKKVFNELFEKSLTKECIPEGLPKVSSMVHKDGKIYLTLNPENIYQINDFLDYCESKEIQNDMANWIFGKEKQRSMCIQECNDNFGVSVKDIGLDVETSEMDCDIAKSWLNKTKGLFTQSENYKMNLPPTYKRLLKDPLMTPSDVSKFLESKEKMLWLNTFAAKKLERFDGKILNDIHRIVNRIYEDRCLTREHVFFCVDNDAEGFQVMYTKLDPEKRVKLQNVTLEVLIDEHMIMRIGDAQNEYEFKSGLLLDYLVATQEEKFIWDRLHIELFPYCIVFRSVDFLKFWIEQRDLADADVLTEMIPEVIMMQGLDQFETDNEVISTLCKDGCFDVPCQLLDVATKYMINFLIKKNLLREVTMQTGGHSYPEEKTQNILKNKIAFQVYRNSPVLETFVLGHTSWINVLKMCQIVSVIGGGQVTIIINEDNELRCSVSLGCYRQGQGNVDEFSLEISNQTEKGLDIKMVSQICQSLHVMENLTVFKMVNTRLTTEFVNDIMSSFTKSNLLHLCFNGNDLIEINWSNLGSIPELEVFEMNGCKLFDQEMISLSTELSKLRYLEIIDVGNNNLTSEGIAALSKHLGKLRYLKALRLQKNILGEDAVGYLADLLCRLPRIEIINLSGCELRNRNIRKLSQVLARKCVRKINLRENCISQNESAVLLRSLAKKSRYLQYLDYSRNVIGLPSKSDTKLQPSSGVISKSEKTIGTSIDDSTSELTPDPDLSLQKILKTNVESLLPSLSSKNESAEAALLDLLEKNSSCVSYLCLWECGLGYTNIFANIKNTTFLTNLTSLCLQNNELNNDFAETIGVCMRNSWHSLQHLNLNHNSISDRGVHALFEGLRLNIALEELLLRGNKVEKERTVLELFRSVTTPEHKNMKTFDICRNAVSEPDREYLNQRMMRMCDMMSVRYKYDGKVTCMKRQNIQVKF